MFALAIYVFTGFYSILKREQSINKDIGSIKFFSIKFSNGVNKVYTDVLTYSITRQPHFRNEALNILRDELDPSFDTLYQFAQNSQDVYTRTASMELGEYYSKFKELTNGLSLIPAEELEFYVKSRITPITYKINKEIDILTITQIKKEASIQQRQVADLQNFYILLGALLLVVLLISYAVSDRIIYTVKRNLETLDNYTEVLKYGNLPDKVQVTQDELQDILDDISYLTDNLNKLKVFAHEVGQGNFNTEVVVFNNSGELGTALAEMRSSLKHISEQEQNRNWLNIGVSKMSEIIRKYPDNIEALADDLLANLIEYTNSSQGGIFLYKPQRQLLELTACYAYGRKKYVEHTIEVGEGLLGTAFQDGLSSVITDIPKDYLTISSGLGKAAPKSLALIPLISQNVRLGVLEIASFNEYKPHHIEFLETIARIFASTITNIITNQNTKKLLMEAQDNEKRLQAQEEMLRQQAEQVEAVREDLQHRYYELETKSNALRQTMDNLALPMLNISLEGVIIYLNPAAARVFDADTETLLHYNLFKLLPSFQEEVQYLQFNTLVERVVYHNISSGRGRTMPYQTTITKMASSNHELVFTLLFTKVQENILA
jgi:PAS domain-containing protein